VVVRAASCCWRLKRVPRIKEMHDKHSSHRMFSPSQVVAMTRGREGGNVEDAGVGSLVLGQGVREGTLPAEESLWLTPNMSRFPAGVKVQGLVDAAVLQAPGAGIRTYNAEGDLSPIDLDDAFGVQQESGFIGVYTSGDNSYLVTRIDGDWYIAALDIVLSTH